MSDMFAGYAERQARSGTWDEMFTPEGDTRPECVNLLDGLRPLVDAELGSRATALSRDFHEQGITFQISGKEAPFPLDMLPRVVSAAQWRVVETGVAQRVRALEAFLADVYGRGDVLRDRVVPTHLVTSSTHFHRAAAGIVPPNGVRIHVAGVDLIRDEAGRFRVLEDNLRCPSGVSYVLENRRTMAKVFPDLFAVERVRSVSGYPARLLAALRASAPPSRDDPTVVVLTPGVHNSAYFEHALLARQMGVELVEGRDLVCRADTVWMRTTEGEQRVDVVYRRVDDDYLDRLHFRSDSVVGCPGLLNAARSGSVTIANAVGNGVADDKLLYTYVPELIRYYLGEEPVLPNVDTFRLEDPEQRGHVLDNLDRMVVKPVDGSGGYGLVIGPTASDQQLAELRTAVLADPRAWIAQPVVRLSTAPTLTDDGFAPRHVDLRPFAVNDGERIWVLPGGLTRVALPEGSLVVNSSQGGGSKDTWVLADDDRRQAVEDALDDVVPAPRQAARAPTGPAPGQETGPWPTGDDQQQQQQQQRQEQQHQQRQQRDVDGPGGDGRC
ncbi:circularly permuted type 2 ATP-grasp protein [Cellulomonas sp. ATA003]|uniref:circularly permuted type 2 ATP-grasp protein n=1 Tax=Cellulomonas sp. ATA003 TaxID=3073064 RepID=UPI0028736628|nr:circularly permuted type 2 ATP-grasp protein [Cellulomonas sp. ATA003]WNB87115.1 circularly permuted type 2 ATP-grasp protein [Cellulomonas sp. ATA003]